FSAFVVEAEDGIRGLHVTGVQTCALPIFEQFARAGFGLRARLPAGDRAVADDAADRVPRIERCERILKDHLDLFAQRTELAFGQPRDVAPVEDHLAAIDADQLEQAFSYRGLARSGLAHDAQ